MTNRCSVFTREFMIYVTPIRKKKLRTVMILLKRENRWRARVNNIVLYCKERKKGFSAVLGTRVRALISSSSARHRVVQHNTTLSTVQCPSGDGRGYGRGTLRTYGDKVFFFLLFILPKWRGCPLMCGGRDTKQYNTKAQYLSLTLSLFVIYIIILKLIDYTRRPAAR